MQYYQKSVEEVASQLKTNTNTGLSQQAVAEHRQTYGANRLPDVKQRGWVSIFLSQFQSPLIYILLIAATIIFFVGEDKLDAFIISGVLFLNAIVGTIQEGRTKNILASLKRFIKTTTVVVRDGTKMVIDDSDLVVGDIVLLQEGQRVPADARVIESNNMQVDESALTGESQAIHKTEALLTDEVPLAERTNMVYKGTYVMAGSGKAIVTAVGVDTEIGKIHKTVEEIQTDIPLRKELEHLSYVILLFILAMCVFLFVIGFATGRPLTELLVILTALFICVVPEGLPVVLTLVLVTGALRMAKRNVLAKNLQAVESLGRADVIVIDKTGTLTRNELVVSRIYADDIDYMVTGQGYYAEGQVLKDEVVVEAPAPSSALYQMGVAASLLNTAEITYLSKLGLFDIKGDPTEAALLIASQKLGFTHDALAKEYKKIYEIPFDSQLKYHAGFFKHDDQVTAYIIGAPEALIDRMVGTKSAAEQELVTLLDDGLRVVAIGAKACKPSDMPSDQLEENEQRTQYKKLLENEVTLLGFMGIQDSIRPEVEGVVHTAREAGLHIIMATGDHEKTALYVAKKTDIFSEGDEVLDGAQFDALSDDQLKDKLAHVTVFSRVTPQQKMRIIQLLHDQHKIVAMTGDGINDAPSLVAADLGIAMGSIGTEVAKAAADLILLDDSFVNIMNAVEEGRHIFYTLRKVILYFFATNMGEILIVLFALMTGLPLPITAAQILWLNLVTDGFLDIGLSLEPKEPGLLSKDWLQKKLRLVDSTLLLKMLFMAIPMGIGSLCVFWHYYEVNITYARTMTLLTMAMFQWFNAWNCRSETQSIFKLGLFANKWLIAATLLVLSLQFLLIYAPFMHYIFKTVSLNMHDWLVVVAVSAPIVLLEEVRKFIVHTWLRRA